MKEWMTNNELYKLSQDVKAEIQKGSAFYWLHKARLDDFQKKNAEAITRMNEKIRSLQQEHGKMDENGQPVWEIENNQRVLAMKSEADREEYNKEMKFFMQQRVQVVM